jgi:hypothetical protein
MAQATRELDIFHQGYIGEATQPFENVSSDEDGLVTKQWPCHRTEATRRPLPPHHPAMPGVELPVKRSPADRLIRGHLHQCTHMFGQQLGVSVVKA